MIQDLRFQGLNIPLGGLESIWQPDIYHGYARESWYLPVIIPTECHPGSKRWMDTSRPKSLRVQPQAIMGSGLVDPRRDSGRTVLRDVEER